MVTQGPIYASLCFGYTQAVMEIQENLRRVQTAVAAAAAKCGRDPASVRILAVSKTFPPADVIKAAASGQRLFGENRVQEANFKVREVGREDLEWHLIGHLQANKVRLALETVDVIQSVDSEKLAHRIDRICADLGKRIRVMIEVNLGEEAQKSGIVVPRVPALVSFMDQLEHLQLTGLMAIPPFAEEPEQSRPYFRRLRQLFDELNACRQEPLTELSMGMSADYPVAVEEGSTLLRIGTAIFGRRG